LLISCALHAAIVALVVVAVAPQAVGAGPHVVNGEPAPLWHGVVIKYERW